MSEPSLKIMWSVIAKHKPRGWKIIERKPENHKGQFKIFGQWSVGIAVYDSKTIIVGTVKDRRDLFVVLHECGHVNCGHFSNDEEGLVSTAQHEYEAEQYAIEAMRAAGIPVPRRSTFLARENVRDFIEEEADISHNEECIKFAYGSKWRKHT